MSLFKAFAAWSRRRARQCDRETLFPSIRIQARDLDHPTRLGDAAISFHVKNDPAWRFCREWEDEGIEEDYTDPLIGSSIDSRYRLLPIEGELLAELRDRLGRDWCLIPRTYDDAVAAVTAFTAEQFLDRMRDL